MDPNSWPTSTEAVIELKPFVEALGIGNRGVINLFVLFGWDEGYTGQTFPLEAYLSDLQESLQTNHTTLSKDRFACGFEQFSLFLPKSGSENTKDDIVNRAE